MSTLTAHSPQEKKMHKFKLVAGLHIDVHPDPTRKKIVGYDASSGKPIEEREEIIYKPGDVITTPQDLTALNRGASKFERLNDSGLPIGSNQNIDTGAFVASLDESQRAALLAALGVGPQTVTAGAVTMPFTEQEKQAVVDAARAGFVSGNFAEVQKPIDPAATYRQMDIASLKKFCKEEEIDIRNCKDNKDQIIQMILAAHGVTV